ncbi:MAG: hypothetical protein QOH26_1199, partial [Actinomycetota bacterium]|nr:hypothetical protein [Actinomycetota bacterium]
MSLPVFKTGEAPNRAWRVRFPSASAKTCSGGPAWPDADLTRLAAARLIGRFDSRPPPLGIC